MKIVIIYSQVKAVKLLLAYSLKIYSHTKIETIKWNLVREYAKCTLLSSSPLLHRVFFNYYIMEQSQIVRFPKKYRDLISSLSHDEAWKLFKRILWEDIELSWNLWIYFWFINSDLENLEKSAMNWWKWWRPQNKPQVITPGYLKWKPQDTKSDNLKGSREEEEEKVEWEVENKEEEKVDYNFEINEIVEYWNNELSTKYKITPELKEVYMKVRKKHETVEIENIILWYIEKCKSMDKKYHLTPFKFFKQTNWFITYKNSVC